MLTYLICLGTLQPGLSAGFEGRGVVGVGGGGGGGESVNGAWCGMLVHNDIAEGKKPIL